MHVHICGAYLMCIVHTCTVEAIAFKTLSTCTVEATICVSTAGIGIACMYLQITLIDICAIRQMNKCAWTNENSYNTMLELYTSYILLKTVTAYNLLVQLTPSPV